MSTLQQLLDEALSWPETKERKKSENLATNIISSTQVDKWKKRGIVIKRGCMARGPSAWIHVHLFDSRKSTSVWIEAEYRPEKSGVPAMTVKSRGQELNGMAPETVLEFIALVEEEAQRMLLQT